MKVAVVAVVFGLSALAGWSTARPASCLYCPSYKCYRRCNAKCACVTVGGGGGQCVGVQALPGYLEHGYSELP